MADSMKDSRSDVQDKLNAKILAYGHSSAPYNSQEVLLDRCQVGPLKRVGYITTTYYYQLSFSYNLRLCAAGSGRSTYPCPSIRWQISFWIMYFELATMITILCIEGRWT